MAIRYLKIVLVVFVALLCVMYAAQNVVNLDEAHTFVVSAVGMQDNVAYPSAFGPAIRNPVLTWAALAVIILAEFGAGLLAAKGACDLWVARNASAATFNAAKTYAVLGCGGALAVWFGLFTVVGGAYFQMWQTALGGASLAGAFQFVAQTGIVLLFVNMTDS